MWVGEAQVSFKVSPKRVIFFFFFQRGSFLNFKKGDLKTLREHILANGLPRWR